MKFIHTADWHLGRSFCNVSLIEDQAHVLEQLIVLVKDTKPDALIISGDIYDRAIPPKEAVSLLDETLSELILGIKIPAVILIAGNHDSPQRLQFGSRLMEKLRLHVFGTISDYPKSIDMFDDWGRVCFYPLPYAEPSILRESFKDEEIADHDSALHAWSKIVWRNHPQDARAVAVNHVFVVGGHGSDSERPLSVGTSGTVDAKRLDGFNYVALGHLHRPQTLGDGRIHYSGSLLKYSFSEADHKKSVNLVQMDGAGKCKVEFVAFKPKRDVRCVEGFMEEILKSQSTLGNNDYVQVKLLDTSTIFDPISRLREIYPNVLDLDRSVMYPEITLATRSIDQRKKDVVSDFGDFFNQVTGTPLNDEQRLAFISVVEKAQQEEREATQPNETD